MKYIIPTNNLGEIKIDDEDFERVGKYGWQSSKIGDTYYAVRYVKGQVKGKRKATLLHRIIMNAPPDKLVDHINHNGLDNRKENLRLVNKIQNQRNALKIESLGGVKCSSKYKGVSKGERGRWRAYINVNKKQVSLKTHSTEEEAALAYNKKAIELFKEHACLNKISPLA